MAIISNRSGKVLAYVGRWGPAFTVSSVEEAHLELDKLDTPREVDGTQLTVLERIVWLRQSTLTPTLSLPGRGGKKVDDVNSSR